VSVAKQVDEAIGGADACEIGVGVSISNAKVTGSAYNGI
jgi:hypothetical protein